MKPELKHAYPALQREWIPYGHVLRRTGTKGTPDFILSIRDKPGIAIFTEVKAVASLHEALGLEVLQTIELDELAKAGLLSRVLAYEVSNRSWSIFYGPFIGRKLYGDSADYYTPHLTPHCLIGD